MNPFVKKEIRLLLPAFVFAVALALASAFFHDREGTWVNGIGYFLGGIFCPAVVVMLALNTFGVEVGTQTFSMMLAQPVTRQRIWQTKILLLALALVGIGLIWFVSVVVPSLYFQGGLVPPNLTEALSVAIILGVTIYSGGLWTVLLLRQVAAAFWFTLIVPGALLAVVAAFCGGSSDEFIMGMTSSVLGIYSLAGFFFARWLFFRAQDLQWTGGAIVMPEWRGLSRNKSARGNLRIWRPRAALWWKEIQLHQSQFVIAFSLAVLHLGVLAVRKFGDVHNPDIQALLEGFWMLWLVMPLLVGCAAVAEERKIGTHEGQLCLPVKRRTQFTIKLLVVMGLSVLFGVLMPLLLEAARILSDPHFESDFHTATLHFFSSSGIEKLEMCLIVLAPAGVVALLSLVPFYISTMTRNTLQSLAPAVLGVMLAFPLFFGAQAPWSQVYHYLWTGPLGSFIVLPIFTLTVLVLAFKNFQSVLTGWRMTVRNLLTLVAALALGVVTTSATYHRFWEKFTPFEPPHGAAQLSLSNSTSLTADWEVTVHLPDGRIWTAPYGPAKVTDRILGNFKVVLEAPKYVPGTDWLSFEHIYWLAAGIKRDGTLWISTNPPPNRSSNVSQDPINCLVQFGNETNWTSLVPYPWDKSLFLVKNDGTLWRLGAANFDSKQKQWLGPLAFTSCRLGTESNWAEVFRSSYQMCLRKKDGSGWIVGGNWSTNGVAQIEIWPGLVAHAVPAFNRNQMRSMTEVFHGLSFGVGIRSDGTFRIWADEKLIGRHGNYERLPADLQIGNGMNWLAVAGGSEKAITLKADGTLWLWNFELNPIRRWEPDLSNGTFGMPFLSVSALTRIGLRFPGAISGRRRSRPTAACGSGRWLMPAASPIWRTRVPSLVEMAGRRCWTSRANRNCLAMFSARQIRPFQIVPKAMSSFHNG